MKRQTVILADDHPLILMGLRDMVEKDASFELLGTVSSSTALVSLMRDAEPDMVITDYSMPGDDTYGDGIRMVKYLIRHFPKTKILTMTMMSNPMIISALYDAGVYAVIRKSDDPAEFIAALHILRLGRKYYPPNFQKESKTNERTKFIGERINSLSPKEFEVLRYFIQGKPIMQVALHLNRSIKTVSGQKIAAMHKLNVKTDQELIAFCLETGLFQ
ncbi:response regulator [Herminiimonas glaciei]|uniref:Response regulator n=1 Tax=Herminiimonas glaciei TaxID=523788 RepID=A0ABW2IBP3_9BURK